MERTEGQTMVRTEPLGVRVTPDLKAELMKAAKAEDRSLASLVERILIAWVVYHPPKNDA
jgi:predicted HicB family RNase H-like nuclease